MAEFEVGHVHALALAGDELLIGTHEGLFVQARGGKASLLGEKFDVMGMTASGGVLYTSGHPDETSKDSRDLGLRTSTNAGRTWDQVSLLGKADFHRLAVSGTAVVGINSHDGQTMRSEDGGKTWTQLGRLPIFDLAMDPTNDRLIVGTTEKGMIVSSDGGRAWSAPASDPLMMLVAYTDAGLVAVTPAGDVFLQTARGWSKQGSLGAAPEAMATDGKRLVIAVKGQVVESSDFGKSFEVRLVGLPGGH
jgi:photosystem II stability/assembly factor-like uncharacterized protein